MAVRKRADALRVLQLDPQSDPTDEEIRKQYKKLALHVHPDKNPDDETSTAKFQELGEAYKHLTNQEEDEIYEDRFREEDIDLFDILYAFFQNRRAYGGCAGFEFMGIGDEYFIIAGPPRYCHGGYHFTCDPGYSSTRHSKGRSARNRNQHQPSSKWQRKQEKRESNYDRDNDEDKPWNPKYTIYENNREPNKPKKPKKPKVKKPETAPPPKKTKEELEAEQKRRKEEREETARQIQEQLKKEAEKEARRIEKERQKQEELRTSSTFTPLYIPTRKAEPVAKERQKPKKRQQNEALKENVKPSKVDGPLEEADNKGLEEVKTADEEQENQEAMPKKQKFRPFNEPAQGPGVLSISENRSNSAQPVYRSNSYSNDGSGYKPNNLPPRLRNQYEKTRTEYRRQPRDSSPYEGLSFIQPPANQSEQRGRTQHQQCNNKPQGGAPQQHHNNWTAAGKQPAWGNRTQSGRSTWENKGKNSRPQGGGGGSVFGNNRPSGRAGWGNNAQSIMSSTRVSKDGEEEWGNNGDVDFVAATSKPAPAAPAPVENIWQQRLDFYQGALPADEVEEERMLQAALEASRLQEQEEKLRIKLDEEERKEHEKTNNPTPHPKTQPCRPAAQQQQQQQCQPPPQPHVQQDKPSSNINPQSVFMFNNQAAPLNTFGQSHAAKSVPPQWASGQVPAAARGRPPHMVQNGPVHNVAQQQPPKWEADTQNQEMVEEQPEEGDKPALSTSNTPVPDVTNNTRAVTNNVQGFMSTAAGFGRGFGRGSSRQSSRSVSVSGDSNSSDPQTSTQLQQKAETTDVFDSGSDCDDDSVDQPTKNCDVVKTNGAAQQQQLRTTNSDTKSAQCIASHSWADSEFNEESNNSAPVFEPTAESVGSNISARESQPPPEEATPRMNGLPSQGAISFGRGVVRRKFGPRARLNKKLISSADAPVVGTNQSSSISVPSVATATSTPTAQSSAIPSVSSGFYTRPQEDTTEKLRNLCDSTAANTNTLHVAGNTISTAQLSNKRNNIFSELDNNTQVARVKGERNDFPYAGTKETYSHPIMTADDGLDRQLPVFPSVTGGQPDHIVQSVAKQGLPEEDTKMGVQNLGSQMNGLSLTASIWSQQPEGVSVSVTDTWANMSHTKTEPPRPSSSDSEVSDCTPPSMSPEPSVVQHQQANNTKSEQQQQQPIHNTVITNNIHPQAASTHNNGNDIGSYLGGYNHPYMNMPMMHTFYGMPAMPTMPFMPSMMPTMPMPIPTPQQHMVGSGGENNGHHQTRSPGQWNGYQNMMPQYGGMTNGISSGSQCAPPDNNNPQGMTNGHQQASSPVLAAPTVPVLPSVMPSFMPFLPTMPLVPQQYSNIGPQKDYNHSYQTSDNSTAS